ncbi:MAG: phosphodiester glycosidase family protein [Frankiaceae bacterium]|nr:phosphodiester glycosidase family protein [Frankiaceae bacterium]
MRSSLPRAAAGLVLLGALLTPLLPSSPATAAPPPAATPPDTEIPYDRLTLRRGDTWFLQPDLDGGPYTSYVEETAGWTPVAGDTDGDGTGTLSLFKDGIWLIRDSAGGPYTAVHFGAKGDVPLMGDWNGDGVDSLGLFRRGRWYLRDNSVFGPSRTFPYGLGTDLPVVGDWDGNGRTDIGVVRNRTWFQRDASSSGVTARQFDFGLPGDRRFAGDWDHDGRDSPGVFRSGMWFLRESNHSGRYQSAAFGRAGDTPLVRRTPGLAPGVTHRVVHDAAGPFAEHIATIDLAAASSPDTVLSGDRLRGTQLLSTMARNAGAVLAINGDYFLSNGRPVHAYAQDGRLRQTPQLLGRAVGIDVSGTRVSMGVPDLRTTLRTDSGTTTVTTEIPRWNSGPATADSVAAFTAAGAELETPPNSDCYAGLAATTNPVVHTDGGVQTSMVVTGPPRCGGAAPIVPPTGVVLDGSHFNPSGTFLQSLRSGQAAQLTQSLGFPGAVDVLGGNPALILGGVQQIQDFYGSDAFFDRQPRTAVGVTDDGRLLLVVVDGRQPGYSVGMTLQELADLMTSLGAVNAINLDGGGSSAMWVNGLRTNRPSDGVERGIGSALVVLPGADTGQADLVVTDPSPSPSPSASGSPNPATAPQLQRQPAPLLVSPVTGGEPVVGWELAARDPGSVGGLAAALADDGVALSPDLQRARAVYESTR